MARSAWPTFASSDTMTGAQFNQYFRDNDLAYWVFTTAGDMAYATSASSLARLAIGAAGQVLTSNGSIPVWAAMPNFSGILHKISTVDFNPDADYGGSWGDVAGATLTLSLAVTCSILVTAGVKGYNTKTTTAYLPLEIRALVDGGADPSATYFQNMGAAVQRNEDLGYIYLATGIAAGSRVVKLQAQGAGASAHVTSGRLTAIAVTE